MSWIRCLAPVSPQSRLSVIFCLLLLDAFQHLYNASDIRARAQKYLLIVWYLAKVAATQRGLPISWLSPWLSSFCSCSRSIDQPLRHVHSDRTTKELSFPFLLI